MPDRLLKKAAGGVPILHHVGLTLFLLILCAVPSVARPLEEATIVEIEADPTAYDQHRVTVCGKVIRIQAIRSFRGDVYLSVTLVEAETNESSATLTVLFWPTQPLKIGEVVGIEGEYHVKWKFGGFEHGHFVDASLVMRKGEHQSPQPPSPLPESEKIIPL